MVSRAAVVAPPACVAKVSAKIFGEFITNAANTIHRAWRANETTCEFGFALVKFLDAQFLVQLAVLTSDLDPHVFC